MGFRASGIFNSNMNLRWKVSSVLEWGWSYVIREERVLWWSLSCKKQIKTKLRYWRWTDGIQCNQTSCNSKEEGCSTELVGLLSSQAFTYSIYKANHKGQYYAFCWILFNYLFCRPLSALLLRCLLVTGENQSQINFSLKCWMRINLAFWSVAHCEPTAWLIFPVTSGNMREILSTSVHIVVCQLNLVVSCGHPTNTIWWQWRSGLIRPMQQFWAK